MNRQFLAAVLLAACGGVVLAMPAFAAGTTATAIGTQVLAGAQDPSALGAATVRNEAERAVPPLDSNLCIRETGSLIPPPKGQCLPVPGNSYSQKEIERTGQPTLGQALQQLDPSVQVHGH